MVKENFRLRNNDKCLIDEIALLSELEVRVRCRNEKFNGK